MARVASLWPLVAAIAVLLLSYGTLLDPSVILSEVSAFHSELGDRHWFYSQLFSGHLRFITPLNDLGHPLLADPTNGIVYLPSLLFGPAPVLASKLWVFGHLLLFMAGVAAWARACGVPTPAAWSIGVIAMATGIPWSSPAHVAVASLAYFPWSMCALHHWTEAPREKSRALLVGVALGMLFVLGDPLLVPLALLLGPRPLPSLWPAALSFLTITGANLLEMLSTWGENARAQGFSSWEQLSYSTHPARLWQLLFPWLSPEAPLGEGFQLQPWFPRIGIGIVLASLMFLGIARGPGRKKWWLLALGATSLLLALGQFSPPSSWILQHLLPFVRYPERFLLHSLLCWLPLAFLGLASLRLRGPALTALLFVSLAENILPLPRPALARSSQVDLLARDGKRYFGCQYGAFGDREKPQYYDLRGLGGSMANAESNTVSSGLKELGCPEALSPSVRRGLGLSAFLFPAVTPEQVDQLRKLGLVDRERAGTGELWLATDASPMRAHWVSGPCQGQDVGITLSQNGSDLELRPALHCSGELVLPWAYQRNWVLEQNGQTLALRPWKRITMSVELSPGPKALVLAYPSITRGALFLTSLLAQFFTVVALGKMYFRMKNPGQKKISGMILPR